MGNSIEYLLGSGAPIACWQSGFSHPDFQSWLEGCNETKPDEMSKGPLPDTESFLQALIFSEDSGELPSVSSQVGSLY